MRFAEESGNFEASFWNYLMSILNSRIRTQHILIYFLAGILLLLFSCATAPTHKIAPPEWFLGLEAAEKDGCYYFPLSVVGPDRASAADLGAEKVFETVMEYTGQSSLYKRAPDRKALLELFRILIHTESAPEDALPVSLERSEWVDNGTHSGFFGYFCIPSDAAVVLETRISQRYYGDDEILQALLASAETYREEKLYYAAAEVLLQAADHVLASGNPLSDQLVREYVSRADLLLRRISIRSLRAPDTVQANRRVDTPFTLLCEEDGAGLSGVEFLIQYRGRKRDGAIGNFEVRAVTGPDGEVDFYHPLIPFAGTSEVVMTPGSRELMSRIRSLEETVSEAGDLKAYLESRKVEFSFAVQSAAREIPTGIVILHTDMTGAPLDSAETASGMNEILRADGFDMEVMDLSALEIVRANELSFLRDLKAAYGDRYARVIYGTVGIQDFTIREESYKVETGGSVKVVDVQTGEILLELEGVKSVESRNNTLAVSASFRELGKALAEDIIRLLY